MIQIGILEVLRVFFFSVQSLCFCALQSKRTLVDLGGL